MGLIDQKRKSGRPALKPNQRQRKLAETCSAAGMSHAEIAAVLNVSKPTLELHFSDELRNGRARRFAEVLVLLDRAARRGSVSAMKFLANLFSGRALLLGKKEQAQRDAANAGGQNTEWGDDLRPVTKLQ